MSKASEVRDAVKAALATELPLQTVETFVIPNYTREELDDGARVIVRNGGRDIRLGQGIDETDVIVEVGVVGICPQKSNEVTTYTAEELDAVDSHDGIMESVIELFMHNGNLSRCPMANHWLTSITQVIQFDPQKLYADGIWLSVIQLTYRDSED